METILLLGTEADKYFSYFDVSKKFLNSFNFKIIERHEQITESCFAVFCTSYYKLIPSDILSKPKHGVFINHSSDLPEGRGWSPIQWSVINGKKEITVTLFKAIGGTKADTGPYALKNTYFVDEIDTINSLRKKDFLVSVELFEKLIFNLESGQIELKEQQGSSSYFPRRYPHDAEIKLDSNLLNLWNFIRICDNQEYPAFFRLKQKKIYLRYEVVDDD